MISPLAALAVLDVAALLLGGLIGVGAAWPLTAHVALTLCGYAIWLRGGGTLRFATAMLGVLGPAAILATLMLRRRSVAGAVIDDDAIFGPPLSHVSQSGAGLAVARLLDGRVHHATPDTLGSLVTIMRHGDIAARRRALETVVRSFEPSLSPLIALALTDGDQTIRALAAAASSRVAQNLAIARDGLTASAKPQAAGLLARMLADHARADVLLSDSQRGNLRQDAVAMIGADDPAHATLLIEALWAAGDYAAIDRMTATLTNADDDTAAVARWWQAEAAA